MARYVGKKHQNGKNLLPPGNRHLAGLVIYISSTQAKVIGVQSQKYKKLAQKSPILMQVLGFAHVLAGKKFQL